MNIVNTNSEIDKIETGVIKDRDPHKNITENQKKWKKNQNQNPGRRILFAKAEEPSRIQEEEEVEDVVKVVDANSTSDFNGEILVNPEGIDPRIFEEPLSIEVEIAIINNPTKTRNVP